MGEDQNRARVLLEIVSVGREIEGKLGEGDPSLRRDVAPVTDAGPGREVRVSALCGEWDWGGAERAHHVFGGPRIAVEAVVTVTRSDGGLVEGASRSCRNGDAGRVLPVVELGGTPPGDGKRCLVRGGGLGESTLQPAKFGKRGRDRPCGPARDTRALQGPPGCAALLATWQRYRPA